MAQLWWKNYFSEDYVQTYQKAGYFDKTKQQTNFLVKNVFPKKTKTILDLCCGHGRHAIELAKRGYEVTGLDYSAYEIKLAKTEAKRLGLDINFIRGDARNYKFKQKFDVVINMFTAFGYGSREDDKKIIKNVKSVLKPKGVFFIDLMSVVWLWKNYKPISKQRVGKYSILAKRNFDFFDNVNSELRIIKHGNRTKKHHMSHRLYTLPELSQLLSSQDLKLTKVWGSFLDESYGFDSKRLLVASRKV